MPPEELLTLKMDELHETMEPLINNTIDHVDALFSILENHRHGNLTTNETFAAVQEQVEGLAWDYDFHNLTRVPIATATFGPAETGEDLEYSIVFVVDELIEDMMTWIDNILLYKKNASRDADEMMLKLLAKDRANIDGDIANLVVVASGVYSGQAGEQWKQVKAQEKQKEMMEAFLKNGGLRAIIPLREE